MYERGQTSRFLAVISLELSRVLLYYETHFVPVGSLVRREEDICHQSRLDFRQLSLHSLPHTHIYFDCTSICCMSSPFTAAANLQGPQPPRDPNNPSSRGRNRNRRGRGGGAQQNGQANGSVDGQEQSQQNGGARGRGGNRSRGGGRGRGRGGGAGQANNTNGRGKLAILRLQAVLELSGVSI